MQLDYAIEGYWLAKRRNFSANTVNDCPLTFKHLTEFVGKTRDLHNPGESLSQEFPMSKSTTKRPRICRTEKDLTALARGSKRICVPIARAEYERIVLEPQAFRQWLDPLIAQYPELFPAAMAQGYQLHDMLPVSQKLPDVRLRRIRVGASEQTGGTIFTIAPAFVLPYMTGYTDAVAHALFLRGKFGVPYWGLTHVFGHNDRHWERLELSLGHNSIVGTTVKHAEHLPQDVLADAKHTWLHGLPVYVATTVADDGILGASVAMHADEADLTAAYQPFKTEAQALKADYQPTTVNTDGWQATQLAWRNLFAHVTLIVCFLHAFLKIRDRCKRLPEHFTELCQRVWDSYHATTAPKFLERCAALQTWANATLPAGAGLDAVRKLCAHAPQFAQAYAHPTAHRTSNMLDRRMDHMDRGFYNAHYFHGHLMTADAGRAVRAEALLVNFLPYCPRAAIAPSSTAHPHTNSTALCITITGSTTS